MDDIASKPSTDFLRNIEEAVKEFGTLACPNPRCFDKLVSKKKWNTSNQKILEYQCQNPNCAYHSKREIVLEKEPKLEKGFSNISYNNIFTFSIIILLTILSYTSYQLYSVNQYLENEVVENRKNQASAGQTTLITDSETPKINKKPTLTSKGLPANNPESIEEKVDIIGFSSQTQTWINLGNFAQGKLNIDQLLNDKKFKSTLLLPENDIIRKYLILMVGDSYKKEGSQFSYHLLQNLSDFNLMENFLIEFDVEKNYLDVFLGKAYLNLPNFLNEKNSVKEVKKYQMIALRHYLTAAKNDRLGEYYSSSIKGIYEISKAYKIFKYNPKNPKRYLNIEKLIKKNHTREIQIRIDYVDRIINRLS